METDPDLPLTWERCHPTTRSLLLDALVWDLVDEAGPNANEPGLAALEHLARAIPTPSETTTTEPTEPQLHAILRTLLREADLNDTIASPATGPNPGPTSTNPIADDELSPHAITRDDTLLGYAFASLKLIGRCPAPLLSAACHAIERQNDPAMLALRAPEDPERFITQRTALRTILECATIEHDNSKA